MIRHGLEFRYNQCRGKTAVFAHDHDLGDELRFLHPVRDLQEDSIELTDVTGVQPTVAIDGFCSQFRPVVVTHHHVRAAIKDFSIRRDLDFAARDDRADGHDFMTTWLRTIDRNDRRRFRWSIAFIDGHARGPESASQPWLQGSGTGDNRPDPATQRFPPKTKDQSISN